MILLKGLKNFVGNIDSLSNWCVHLSSTELTVIFPYLMVKLVFIKFDLAVFLKQIKGKYIKVRVWVRFRYLLLAEYAF